MVKRHLKRFGAPGYWGISVKEYKWTVRPNPGPHPKNRCIPAVILIRNILKFADNHREAKYILNNGEMLVDGRTVKEPKYPVGLMDVVSFPSRDMYYRVVPSRRVLTLQEIEKDQANKKLVKITGKSTVKGGHIQIHLHDGRNILIRVKNPGNPEVEYRVGDSLLIEVPSQKILQHIPEKSGNLAVVTGGSHISEKATLLEIRKNVMRPDVSVLASKKKFETLRDYVFMIGQGENPVIPL
mgnify:CR=1 FL=1